jgi:hypothetical protein
VKRRIAAALGSWVIAVFALACAKAPEARPNATTESSVEPTAEAGAGSALSERDASDAGADADARVPGLPMPQKFPHFVWDAAGAPPRDAAAAR